MAAFRCEGDDDFVLLPLLVDEPDALDSTRRRFAVRVPSSPVSFPSIPSEEPSGDLDRALDVAPLSSTSSLSNALMVRGGGGGVSVFADWVASSKARSWAVLFTSIIFDTVSTALMKHARESSSIPKVCLAFLGYFCRYGTLSVYYCLV